MSNFKSFASSMAVHFTVMSASELYRVDLDGDALWQAYLAAFPEGSNPIYRVRTTHDGSYDRAFIRKLGNVVRINSDGTLTSIWDVRDALPYPYGHVCAALSALVKATPIAGLFRSKERTLGVQRNVERKNGETTEFFHFHANVAAKHVTPDVDAVLGEFNTTVGVIRRGFTEITADAVDTVLDLITSGNLYRGAEFKAGIEGFRASQQRFLDAPDDQQRTIVCLTSFGSAGARIRNTAIGTLLTDLSDGVELERAVKAYELKVAPANYKRPTALITQGMIDQAMTTIDALGLRTALQRRHASLSDLSVNNVLWVDNQAQAQMKDGLRDLLASAAKPAQVQDTPNALPIDRFLQEVLPTATGMELFFGNDKQANLMSLTAPYHTDVAPLFKWGNNFAWSYNGNITDSIKEKVKAAGGNTDAVLRVSLAWFNYDDLDLHCAGPDGHIYFGDKSGSGRYANKRNILDVDMNAGGGQTRTPVENLSWTEPKDGKYRIMIDQYCRRETTDIGFVLEVANAGKVTQYSYPKAVNRETTAGLMALEFTVKNQVITELTVKNKDITGQGIAQSKWGLSTENFVKVNTVLHSPNHWDGEQTGNKHWFFILEGCHNDEPARGIYNEFLRPELEAHRKVFEVLGNKTKCVPSAEQLSGLGFSSTQRDSVIVRVTEASSTRLYKVTF